MDLAQLRARLEAIRTGTDPDENLDQRWIDDPAAPNTLREAIQGGFDALIVERLNLARPAIRMPRRDVASDEVRQAIRSAALNALTPAQRSWLDFQLLAVTVPLFDLAIWAEMEAMFPPASAQPAVRATHAALTLLRTRAGSVAEQHWGEGVEVTTEHVGRAFAAEREADNRTRFPNG